MSLHQRPLAWLSLSVLLSLLVATEARAQASAATAPAPASAPAPTAGSDDPFAAPPPEPVGSQSRQWLRAQSTREQASATRPTLSGPAMTAVHERYMRSFTAPIEPTSLHNRAAINSN